MKKRWLFTVLGIFFLLTLYTYLHISMHKTNKEEYVFLMDKKDLLKEIEKSKENYYLIETYRYVDINKTITVPTFPYEGTFFSFNYTNLIFKNNNSLIVYDNQTNSYYVIILLEDEEKIKNKYNIRSINKTEFQKIKERLIS